MSDKIIHIAESLGWQAALYSYNKQHLEEVGIIDEDQRCADWKYLLPLNNKSDLLLLGCGWGAVPVALSEVCGSVYAIDSTWDKIRFLDIRREQQGIENLFPIYGRCDSDIPFPDESFDIVAVNELEGKEKDPQPFRKAVQNFHRLLKEKGVLYLSLYNRFSFQRLLRRGEKPASSVYHSIFGYKRILKEEGFSKIRFYAPLPRQDGIPLFFVPLNSDQSLNFFFHNIFPLFEAVSPEVKKAYGFQYTIAKVAVHLTPLFLLTFLTKILVPGYGIIAENK